MRTIFVRAGLVAGLALGALAFHGAPVEAKGKCVLAGGEATMVTEDLAKFMAEAALKNSIAAHGWTAAGAVSMKCDSPNGLPHCLARRKACG